MRTLSVVGMAAMFPVGGGILLHGLPGAHHIVHGVTHAAKSVPVIGGLLTTLAPVLLGAIGGIAAGATCSLRSA